MPSLESIVVRVLGPDGDPNALAPLQIAARGAVVYLFGLAALRLAGPRVLGRLAAIDVLVGIVLGSILSRAVNGHAPMGGSLIGAAAVVFAHWALAAVACRRPGFASLVKGKPVVLIDGGRVDRRALRRNSLGPHDVEEALRLAGYPRPEEVGRAVLERNGRISVEPAPGAVPARPSDSGGPVGNGEGGGEG